MRKRISRPDLIKKLTDKWSTYYQSEPFLKSVAIESSTPLRGITNGLLNIEFPVSVICGENGTGKTTFLSLSILGFHASQTPITYTDYFSFNYFFPTTARDRHDEGIKLIWEYTNGKKDDITKGARRWLRYIKNSGLPRRVVRGTEFIGISRITPAFEKKNYPSYFTKSNIEETARGDKLKELIGYIMSRPYQDLSELSYSNSSGTHSVHSYNKTHTSFNAGAGEECLSYILKTLLECEEESIIAIEEIEIGLHPSTLSKLTDVILYLAFERKLQILITSHSSEFLRSFPKEGLILATRAKDKIEFINQPNVEYAINKIGGKSDAAANILCEDPIAEKLISTAMPYKLRSICPVICFGGKNELIKKAETIRSFSKNEKIIIIWDGEVEQKLLDEAINKDFNGLKLPSNLEPENYIISKLKTPQGKDYLSSQYRLEPSDLRELIDKISVLDDCHDLTYELAHHLRMTGSEEAIMTGIINFITKEFEDEFTGLISSIEAIVNA